MRAEALAVARLEWAEIRRSRWALFCGGVYALLASVFVLVGLRESNVLGFSGMGRVLLSFAHALVLILPLLALTAMGQVINRARDDGTLELLFSHPVRRHTYFLTVTLLRAGVLVVPLVLLVVALGAVAALAFGQQIPWGFVARTLVLSASLLVAFLGIGAAITTWVRNPTRAMLWILFAWAAGVALLDFGLIGLMLQWRLDPRAVFLIAALNPVQAVRVALLAGITPELSVLGPVGFFLSTRLGPSALLAIGIGWPLLVGVGAGWAALGRFVRGDLV
jgi:ABC-2 type transport system permease protein